MNRSTPSNPPHLHGPLSRLAASCATPFYAAAVALRNTAFNRGWRKIHRAHVPVVSVGNLTTGGTGKTPTVAYIVHTLQHYGSRPAVILRGYRADERGRSDERELLAQLLPDTPILAEPDRVAAVRRIESQYAEVDVIVLDDGFQHRRLGRNLNLVLIDSTNPFGYGRMLPRGLLREPPKALRRADAIILTHADMADEKTVEELNQCITAYHGRAPIARTAHTWSRIIDGGDQPVTDTAKARVFVVAGIGNPDAFLDQAANRFLLAGTQLLPDHAQYTRAILGDLQRSITQCGASALLTTEKDWVKLGPLLKGHPLTVPVWRPHLSLAFLYGEKNFNRLLLGAAQSRAGL